MTVKYELGFYKDLENKLYHDDREYISSSGLKLVLNDVRTFYNTYVKEQPPEEESENTNYTFGSYVHSLLLEPDKTDSEFAIFNGLAKRGKAYTEFKKLNADKEIITKTMSDKGLLLRDKALENPDVVELLSEGTPEMSLFTEIDGIKVKVRADYMYNEQRGGYVADIKTTGDRITANAVKNTIAKYSYDLSAALYTDCFAAQLGMDFNFYFIFLDKVRNDCAVFKASKQMLDNGRRKYMEAIRILKEARASGKYFEDGIQEIELYKNDLVDYSEEVK